MLVGGSCLAASGGLNTCKCSLLISFGQYVVQTKLVIIAHISWLHKVPHLRHHPDVRDVGARHAGRGLGLHHDLELTLSEQLAMVSTSQHSLAPVRQFPVMVLVPKQEHLVSSHHIIIRSWSSLITCSISSSDTGTGKLLMMWWKSSLVMKCLFSLYFLARKSVGKGSVPQNIYKHQMMLTAFIHILVSIVKVMYLKCIFVKVLLFLFTLSEVFQHQLTEVRKINETIPRTLST